jgi:hypothetical protein
MLSFFTASSSRLPKSDQGHSKEASGILSTLGRFSDAAIGLSLMIIGPLLIGSGFALMGYIIYLFFTLIFPSYFPTITPVAVGHLIMDAMMIFNIFYNYIKCIRTSPGYAPLNVLLFLAYFFAEGILTHGLSIRCLKMW